MARVNPFQVLDEQIREEIKTEIQDKIYLHSDGVDIKDIYLDDFRILKKMQYKDVNWYCKRGYLEATQVRSLLYLIDTKIDEAVSFIKYNIIYREERANEN